MAESSRKQRLEEQQASETEALQQPPRKKQKTESPREGSAPSKRRRPTSEGSVLSYRGLAPPAEPPWAPQLRIEAPPPAALEAGPEGETDADRES